jgi:hypothetical protein
VRSGASSFEYKYFVIVRKIGRKLCRVREGLLRFELRLSHLEEFLDPFSTAFGAAARERDLSRRGWLNGLGDPR